MYSVSNQGSTALIRCPNGCMENTLTHFLFYRLKLLHECWRFEVLGKIPVCHVLFLGIIPTSTTLTVAPIFFIFFFFCTHSSGQSPIRYSRVKSGRTQPKTKCLDGVQSQLQPLDLWLQPSLRAADDNPEPQPGHLVKSNQILVWLHFHSYATVCTGRFWVWT